MEISLVCAPFSSLYKILHLVDKPNSASCATYRPSKADYQATRRPATLIVSFPAHTLQPRYLFECSWVLTSTYEFFSWGTFRPGSERDSLPLTTRLSPPYVVLYRQKEAAESVQVIVLSIKGLFQRNCLTNICFSIARNWCLTGTPRVFSVPVWLTWKLLAK